MLELDAVFLYMIVQHQPLMSRIPQELHIYYTIIQHKFEVSKRLS